MQEEKDNIKISFKSLKFGLGLILEIMLSAILIVAVVFSTMLLITKKNVTNLQDQARAIESLKNDGATETEKITQTPCGIEINNLMSGDKLSFPISISGTIDSRVSQSCGWSLYEGTAGNIKIIDMKGNKIAGPEQIKMEDTWLDLVLLKKTIKWTSELNQIYEPQTQEGVIYFESQNQINRETGYEFILPIKF